MSGIESWSTTPANNNQASPFGWPAGILPNQVEPIGRQMMTSLAAWYQAAEWINYNFTPTYIGATQFSLPGNATATYHVARRVQATDGSTSVFGTITVSAFTTLTTVTVVWDTGVLQTGVTIVYVGITSAVNTSAPAVSALAGAAFANPSGSVGLTAVNGSATTVMRSDGAPPLSQAIAPTWSGNHLWSQSQNSLIGAVVLKNANAGAAAAIFQQLQNSTNAFTIAYTSTAYSGSLLVNGPAGEGAGVYTNASFPLAFGTAGIARFSISAAGVVQAIDDAGNFQTVGWRDIPQNLQTTSYGPVLADRGKGVDFNGASLTCTIPANATIAFPIGTTILITNLNASALSIAITTDTLTLAGTTTTGTRTLSQNGMATIRKVTATSWLISGSGVS